MIDRPRLTAYLIIASLALTQLYAQDSKTTTKPAKVFKNVQAAGEQIEAIGPIDTDLSGPLAKRRSGVGDESMLFGAKSAIVKSSPSGVASKVHGLEIAGPSAVLAAGKLPEVHTESFSFGESLFFLASQRSQPLTTKWKDGAKANGGQDPQIAAGHSVIAVLTWDTLAFYDKNGNLLPSTEHFTNPTNTETIFAKVVKALDQNLHLNSKAKNDPTFLFEAGEVGDARVIFDNFRNRWVVLATAKNNHPNTKDFALLTSQRRTKFLLAVSRDEDPRKGFHTLGFNATPDDGACGKNSDDSPCPGSHFTPGNAADYPSLGVSGTHYIMTAGVGHAPLDASEHTKLFSFMVVMNADDVANGNSPIRMRSFAGWDLGDGDRPIGVALPVVMENDLPLGGPLVGKGWGVVASTVDSRFVLTAVGPTDPPELHAMSWDMPDMQGAPDWPQKGSLKAVSYGNVGNQPITATLTGTTLVTGFVDCRTWVNSQSECSPSLHLLAMDLTLFPVTSTLGKDRVVGWRSVLDDAPNDVVAYGLPGIASNNDGDIAVVYGRSSPKMFMETRFSTWLHNEVDIRPSRELQKGEAPIPAQLSDCAAGCKSTHSDTAGVSLDPFDNKSIWIAHSFADPGSNVRVAVGKVFGERHPDLWVLSAKLSTPTTGLKPGDPVGVNVELYNGGDGAAPSSRAELLLIATDGKKSSLGHTNPSDIHAGDSIETNLVGTIPASLAKGAYKVEVRAKLQKGLRQYSEDNDVLVAGTVHVK